MKEDEWNIFFNELITKTMYTLANVAGSCLLCVRVGVGVCVFVCVGVNAYFPFEHRRVYVRA